VALRDHDQSGPGSGLGSAQRRAPPGLVDRHAAQLSGVPHTAPKTPPSAQCPAEDSQPHPASLPVPTGAIRREGGLAKTATRLEHYKEIRTTRRSPTIPCQTSSPRSAHCGTGLVEVA